MIRDQRPRRRWCGLVVGLMLGLPAGTVAQGMPDPKEMSGLVLPVSDLPVGTIAVRVIRGSFDQNLAGQPVEFLVDGARRSVTTDADGRAQISGLPRGSRVRVATTVDGERLESQEAVVQASGLRIVLVASDRAAGATAAESTGTAGTAGKLVFGPRSQIFAELSSDRLHIFYLLEVVNASASPVDPGGPLIIDLPRQARSSTILQGSTPQATANGPRVTVTGPFASGSTAVRIAYELPHAGDTARIEQRWPVALEQVTVVAQKMDGLSIVSPQLASTGEVVDQGRALVLRTGPGLAAGQVLTLEFGGLPHHPSWPRTVALALAAIIMSAGLWGALTAGPGRSR